MKNNKGTYSHSNRHQMHEPQVTNYNEVANFKRIIVELTKDKERLDFLLNRAYAIQINEGDIVSSREKIDKAMNQ